MLTEQEVARSWSQLFRREVSEEALTRAEDLIEELRPESPLRLRLTRELVELREMSAKRDRVAAGKC